MHYIFENLERWNSIQVDSDRIARTIDNNL